MTLALTLAAIAILSAAAVTDVAHRRISNRLVTALAAIGLLRIALEFAGPLGWSAFPAAIQDVGAALAMFCAGALAFHFRLLGGGDVKLLAATTLWVGAGSFGPLLVLTGLAGGVLAIAYVTLAAVTAGDVRVRQGLPYGVAIASGGIATTFTIL